jgi:uncharacterized RDD family membrane protein YckC
MPAKQKQTCPNHPGKKATKLCMGCGKYFCKECVNFVHGVAYCSECEDVAAQLREAKTMSDSGAEEDYGEAPGMNYAPTGEDAVWEKSFESSKMVKVNRQRLAALNHPLPLQEYQASSVKRIVAHAIDLGIILLLAIGPFVLYERGWFRSFLPADEEGSFLVLFVHAVLAFFYYRIIFVYLVGGRTFGRVVAGIRLVNSKGAYPGFGHSLIHTLLEAVGDLPLMIPAVVNGIAHMISKENKSLIDRLTGTQVVEDEPWHDVAQKRLYAEDVSRMGS